MAACPPPHGTPREGSVDLGQHATLFDLSLPSRARDLNHHASLSLPESALYSELKRVREEADTLRRDVASQCVLQQAAQAEL